MPSQLLLDVIRGQAEVVRRSLDGRSVAEDVTPEDVIRLLENVRHMAEQLIKDWEGFRSRVWEGDRFRQLCEGFAASAEAVQTAFKGTVTKQEAPRAGTDDRLFAEVAEVEKEARRLATWAIHRKGLPIDMDAVEAGRKAYAEGRFVRLSKGTT